LHTRYILFFSEKWNRRPTLYISGLLMACCFVIVNVVNKTTPGPKNHQATPAGIATVAMVFLTNSIYQFSWGPLPWPYAAEVSPPLLNPHHTLWQGWPSLQIFPTRIREVGTSVGVSTQWLFNFLFSLVTPYMIAAWGSYTFTFYAILDITMATLVFLFLKETKGKSVEEMETIFHSRAAFDVELARKQGMEGGFESHAEEIEVHELKGR